MRFLSFELTHRGMRKLVKYFLRAFQCRGLDQAHNPQKVLQDK